MSTETRRQEKSQLKDWLARLAAFFSTMVVLLQKGTRSEHMVETLFRAFQLFKENRFGGVVSIDVGEPETLPGNFLQLLSMKIIDLTISERAKKYFLVDGVLYVGEAYRYTSSDRGKSGRGKKSKAAHELGEALLALGLPLQLDPVKAGWRPPYWDNAETMVALNTPLLEAIRDEFSADRFHQRKMHYLGQLLLRRQTYPYLRLQDRQRILTERMRGLGVHAGMYLPDGWTPPEGEPTVWQEYHERKEREQREEQLREVEAHARTVGTSEDLDLARLFKRVSELECSVRTYNGLENAGVVYVGDLVQKVEGELLKIKNFGRKSLREVKEILAELGLALGMSTENQTIASFSKMRQTQKD